MSATTNGWIMKTIYLVAILLGYLSAIGFTFPSRPLNERSPELTWEAWLLVDENQNQNRHPLLNADGTFRRRITPKSVFIAPTFSPESLPACADGYSSDPMGRCIKIIKLDEEAHYDFIIKNLEDKFGSFDYEDEENVEEVEGTSPGPLQFNIPLTEDKNENKGDDSEEETDIAIVVSPTKPIFDMMKLNFNKRGSLEDEQQQETLLKDLVTGHSVKSTPNTTPSPLTTIADETTTTEKIDETTTSVEDVVTESVGTTILGDDYTDTSTQTEVETTTANTIYNTETTTEDYLTTTTNNPTVTVITDPAVTQYKLSTQSPKPVDVQNDEQLGTTSVLPRFEPTTSSPKPEITTKTFVRFPDQEKSHQHLENSYVRFPDSELSFQTQIPPTVGTREIQDFGVPGFYRQSEKPVVFRDNIPPSDNTNVDYSDIGTVSNKAARWEFNRRNRDKNSSVFMLPPKWNPSTFQKPLVLRFSRKHSFMDNNEFKRPTYYRSIPPDDFAYLFKFKQKRIRR